MKKIIYICLIGLTVLATSCYEDFEANNPFTAVYFPFQRPIRTVVSTDPNFEIGVVLAGKRENNANERVTVSFDPSLLNGTGKTLLPSNYFSMAFEPDSTIVIPAGTFFGEVPVTLTEDFFNDPLSIGDNYIIPLRITRVSTDSVLSAKFFTLTAIQYINPFHGGYWQKGRDNPSVGDPVIYDEPDLVKNGRANLATVDRNKLAYTNIASQSGVDVEMTIGANNAVTMEHVSGADSFTQTSASYDPATKTFALSYTYEVGGVSHTIEEQLIYSNTEFTVDEWSN